MKEQFVKYKEEKELCEYPGIKHYPLFEEKNTPIPGCYSMLHIVTSTEYTVEQAHDDHEGFFVARGSGMIKIDGIEYALYPGCAMYAPAGKMHTLKSNGEEMEVFIYHFPV